MIGTGWNNGSPNNESGAGYGIRISRQDRDQYFRREWTSVTIELEDDEVVEIEIPLSESFWRNCTELRGAEIGRWMLRQGFAPWPEGNPPKFELISLGKGRFRLA